MAKNEDPQTDSGFELGRRLLEIRKFYGLSQRELARRASMTNANLSMIETGKVSPSLHTLEKILQAVNLSLSSFFNSDGAMHATYVPAEQLSRHHIQDVVVKSMPLHWQAKASGMSQVLIPAGARTSSLFAAQTSVDVVGFVCSGEVMLSVDSECFVMSSGDGFRICGGRSYTLVNESSEEAELHVVHGA